MNCSIDIILQILLFVDLKTLINYEITHRLSKLDKIKLEKVWKLLFLLAKKHQLAIVQNVQSINLGYKTQFKMLQRVLNDKQYPIEIEIHSKIYRNQVTICINVQDYNNTQTLLHNFPGYHLKQIVWRVWQSMNNSRACTDCTMAWIHSCSCFLCLCCFVAALRNRMDKDILMVAKNELCIICSELLLLGKRLEIQVLRIHESFNECLFDFKIMFYPPVSLFGNYFKAEHISCDNSMIVWRHNDPFGLSD